MSETTDRKRKVMTHAEFYRVCEALKEERQRFLDEKPKKRKAAAMLSQIVGFAVPLHSIDQLQEATGIHWESRKTATASGQSAKQQTYNVVRALVRAVHLLYRKLGEEVPAAIQAYYEEYERARVSDAPSVPTESNGMAKPPMPTKPEAPTLIHR